MKKLFVSVSLCALLCAPCAYADYVFVRSGDFKVTAGGDLNLQAGARFQSSSKYTKAESGQLAKQGVTANNNDFGFNTGAHVHFGIENKTAKGLAYGAQIGVQANARGSFPSRDGLGRTYVFFEDTWGRVEIGTKKGASKSMQTNADAIAAATGGIAGDWGNYMALDTWDPDTGYANQAIYEDNFTDSPKIFIKDNDAQANNEGNRKLTYYTPKFNGVQLGASYIPDEENRGLTKLTDEKTPTRRLRNVIAGGITFDKEIDKKQKFKVAIVGETGKLTRSVQDKINDRHFCSPSAYNVGATYTYDKVSVAASYGNRGKALHRKPMNPGELSVKPTQFYTAGVAYQVTDDLNTSLTYFHSWNRNTLDIISLGTSYKWLPGISPYAEVTHVIAKQKYNYDPVKYNTKSNGTPGPTNFKNKGTVAIGGIIVSF